MSEESDAINSALNALDEYVNYLMSREEENAISARLAESEFLRDFTGFLLNRLSVRQSNDSGDLFRFLSEDTKNRCIWICMDSFRISIVEQQTVMKNSGFFHSRVSYKETADYFDLNDSDIKELPNDTYQKVFCELLLTALQELSPISNLLHFEKKEYSGSNEESAWTHCIKIKII